jgi:hypothetical protein
VKEMPRAIINQKPIKDRFVEELRTGATPAKAARAAGISRALAYEWREADMAFDRAWADAVAEGVDKLEDEAFRRAHDGYSSRASVGRANAQFQRHLENHASTARALSA